jgi:PEP-CTERM motif-containing protein
MTSKLARIAFAIGLVASATALSAQTQSRSWTMCSDDLFSECNSIRLTTTAADSAGIRVGTYVGLAFQNLQGSSPLDNSDARTIWKFSISGNYIGGPTDASDPSTPSAIFIGDGAGGGPPNGERDVLGFEVFAPGGYATLYDQVEFAGVQGCDADPTWDFAANAGGIGAGRPPYSTCGPDAWVSFPVFNRILPWIDADQMTDATLGGTGVDGAFFTECAGNSSHCVVTTSATPEPATIVLVGTGLFGVLAGRKRRRKEHDPAQA